MDQSLVEVMEELFISKDGADVTFIIHGKEVKAHKIIVTSRSAVFKTMIEGSMAPADQRHLINDPTITAEDFEKFLKFLYADKIDYPFQKADIKAMIHLGSFYDVPFLLKKCAERMGLHSSEDAYEYAEMALEYLPVTIDLLEKCLICIIVNHYEAPMNYRCSDGKVKWISQELVLEIVKRRSRDGRLSENALFAKVYKWAKNACFWKNDRYPTPDDIQEMMLPLMPYFVISELSPLTLATKVKTNKLIPLEDLVNHLADRIVETGDEYSNRGRLFFRGERERRGDGRGGGHGGNSYRNRFSPAVEELRRLGFANLTARGGRGRGGFDYIDYQ